MSFKEKDSLEKMLAEGLSQSAIAKHYGTYQANVRYYCVKYGLNSKWAKHNQLNRELRSEEKKKCSGPCGEIRHFDEFAPDLRASDQLSSECRVCGRIRIRDRQRQLYADPKTRLIIQERSRKWKTANPEKVKAYSVRYWAENKEVCKARRAAWITPERMSITVGYTGTAKEAQKVIVPSLSYKLASTTTADCAGSVALRWRL